MGPAARRVTLIEGDVLTAALPEGLVVWHDRAVLHFSWTTPNGHGTGSRSDAASPQGGS
jgi:hypothetical protein